MKQFETPTSIIDILSESTVLLRPKEGVEVDYEAARRGSELIVEAMPGDFGMIIERAKDYSFAPMEVFNVLNEIPSLKAIAIAVHKYSSLSSAETGKMFFDRDLEIFFSVDHASDWIKSILE